MKLKRVKRQFNTSAVLPVAVFILLLKTAFSFAAPLLPDFVISSASCPTGIVEGQVISVNLVVENQGNAPGDGKYLDVWHTRSHGWPDVGEVGEGWEEVGILQSGNSRTIEVSSIEVREGTNSLCAFIEFENRVSESCNTNNHLIFEYFADAVSTNLTPVYRFWSPVYQGHFFTISENEKSNIIENLSHDWKYEGVAYYVPADAAPGTKPVFRFWSSIYQGHFFTISENEKSNIIENLSHDWKYEGIAYYTYPVKVKNTSPVYRFWSTIYRHHFYTISQAEKENIITNLTRDWRYENIIYYAFPTDNKKNIGEDHVGDSSSFATKSNETHEGENYLSDESVLSQTINQFDHKETDGIILTDISSNAGNLEIEYSGGEGDMSFAIYYFDSTVTVSVYDVTEDTRTNILENASTPVEAVISDIKPEHEYVLSVFADETGEERLIHESLFIRTKESASAEIDCMEQTVSASSGSIGKPVERIILPESEAAMTVKLYSESGELVHTVYDVSGGAVVEVTLPDWNCWYKLDAERDDNSQPVFSIRIKHTHVN